jgi:hypothetical protein
MLKQKWGELSPQDQQEVQWSIDNPDTALFAWDIKEFTGENPTKPGGVDSGKYGTGLRSKDTVTIDTGNGKEVFYANAVNYILYGALAALAARDNPDDSEGYDEVSTLRTVIIYRAVMQLKDGKGVFAQKEFADIGYRAVMDGGPLDFSPVRGMGIPGLKPGVDYTDGLEWTAGPNKGILRVLFDYYKDDIYNGVLGSAAGAVNPFFLNVKPPKLQPPENLKYYIDFEQK